MKKLNILFIFLALCCMVADAQKVSSRKKFFTDTAVIHATLTTDFGKLIGQKKEPVYIPAKLTWSKAENGADVTEDMQVKLRGNFRKDQCSFASMMFNFKDSTKESKLKNLKELKIVVPCEWGSDDEQWVFREYLVYKIYQLFTDVSFRVRLLRFTFNDVSDYMKPYKQYGFALEPIDDLAKRNNAKEIGAKQKIGSEDTERSHTTLINIFQYMVGNSDWAIPPRHNIKMIRYKDSAAIKPLVIPYDFDYCGAVNALYADPAPSLGIEKVTDRLYMGYARTMPEIKTTIALFQQKEQAVYAVINDFPLLKKDSKQEMLDYIKSFYAAIQDEAYLQKVFIAGAK